MIYLSLLFSFFKIGLFSYGGGYAMIPLIQKEIESHSWLSSSEFIDIIAIAEMTPGPIAVNSATFVGYKTAGILGGVSASVGVALPSLILAILVSEIFFKYQKHPLSTSVFYGIRPVIASLIMTAAILIAETSIFTEELSIKSLSLLTSNPLRLIDVPSVIILALTFFALVKLKIHPILVILGSGVLGILVFGFV